MATIPDEELAELRRDRERLVWLLRWCGRDLYYACGFMGRLSTESGIAEAIAAIDAAMEASEE